MPDLPNYRVSEDPPFSHTGMDFAGPLYVKGLKHDKSSTSKPTSNKVWVLLLTCAATRAVHLELVRGLDVPTFLLFEDSLVEEGFQLLSFRTTQKRLRALRESCRELFDHKRYFVISLVITLPGNSLSTVLPGGEVFGREW